MRNIKFLIFSLAFIVSTQNLVKADVQMLNNFSIAIHNIEEGDDKKKKCKKDCKKNAEDKQCCKSKETNSDNATAAKVNKEEKASAKSSCSKQTEKKACCASKAK